MCENITIRNPNSVRPWQHVLEPVIGYLFLGLYLNHKPIDYAQAYNFGPQAQDTLSVEKMLKLVIKAWGNGTYKIETEDNQPHEAGLLKLDISKVESQLNWRPKMNAHQTIKLTIDWYANFKEDKKGLSAFTEQQILSFLNG